jgi:hypothetical protein
VEGLDDVHRALARSSALGEVHRQPDWREQLLEPHPVATPQGDRLYTMHPDVKVVVPAE